MSADNGVYILVTPAYPIKVSDNCYQNVDYFDYRVAVCQGIENIQYSDMMMVMFFHQSPVFHNEQEALQYAKKLEVEHNKDGDCLEYGIEFWNEDYKYYPNMTVAAARKALDCYEGASPLDYKE